MNLLTKHPPCTGLTLWKSKKKVVMLWFTPPYSEIKNHYHRQQDNKLILLYGWAFISRAMIAHTTRFATFTNRSRRRCHNIPAYTWHGAVTRKQWFIFLSITTPTPGNQLQKPNEDIVYQGDIQSTYDNIKGPTR